MSKKDEQKIAAILSEEIGLTFKGTRYSMGQWGQADDWAELATNRLLILEVETNQKHPNTNVLKIWPWLEQNSNISIVLVHAFFTYSPGSKSNRGKLACWVAEKMRVFLAGRFIYHRLVVAEDLQIIEGLESIRDTVDGL